MNVKRNFCLALGLASLLAGCGTAGLGGMPLGADDAALSANALSSDDQGRTREAVEELANQFADDVEATPTTPTLLGQRGNLLYRAFDASSLLRKVAYTLSDTIVSRHFSKPGKQDDVPPFTPEQRTALRAALRPGDVIQVGNNASFVHAIFYLGDDQIIHSLAQAGFGRKMIGVRAETLTEYLDRCPRDKAVVLRPHWTPQKLATAVAFAQGQVGKGYDTLFMTDNEDRFYCTELVYDVLTHAAVAHVEPHRTSIGWRIVMNEDLRRSSDLDVAFRLNHE